MIIDDIKRKGIYSEIMHRLTRLEADVRKIQASSELTDSPHPLAELGRVVSSGVEEDIKRKGMISEIIRRITKLETDVRKLQAKG